MDDVSYVNSSGSDTFVIKTDGSLWAWGLNHSGTLGIGSEDRSEERRVGKEC